MNIAAIFGVVDPWVSTAFIFMACIFLGLLFTYLWNRDFCVPVKPVPPPTPANGVRRRREYLDAYYYGV